jgi:hypothetical protein
MIARLALVTVMPVSEAMILTEAPIAANVALQIIHIMSKQVFNLLRLGNQITQFPSTTMGLCAYGALIRALFRPVDSLAISNCIAVDCPDCTLNVLAAFN